MLRDWFESNRAKYDEPARYDFEEAVLAGDRSEAAVRAFAAALNAGTPGDAEAGLRVFTARPHDNIVQSYGAEFATALEARAGRRVAALPSSEGLRVMRLEVDDAGAARRFEDLRGVVLQDWTDAMMAEQRSAAVRALAKQVHRQGRRTRRNERVSMRWSRCCCWRCVAQRASAHEMTHGRDGAARDAARRVPVAMGRERQPPVADELTPLWPDGCRSRRQRCCVVARRA